MEKIALITDSCADIPAEYRNKYDIHVVPLIIQTIDGEYKDELNNNERFVCTFSGFLTGALRSFKYE